MSQEIIEDQYREIKNLRAQVEAVKRENETLKIGKGNTEILLAACQDQYQQLEQERDNLQAANAVLRGALEEVSKIEDNSNGETWEETERLMITALDEISGICKQALSATPAEAGERVQGLVDALEDIAKANDGYLSKWANDALAKYRGGAD